MLVPHAAVTAGLPVLRLLDYRVPPLAPVLTAAALVVAGVVFAMRTGTRAHRLATAYAVFWVLFTASLTLTPQRPLRWEARRGPVIICELVPQTRSVAEFLATGDDWMNVLLFIPLGLLVVLLVRRGRRIPWYAVLFAAPPLVETFQAFASTFYRTCQTKDLLTNWSGALLGIALGAAFVAVARTGPLTQEGAAIRRR